MLACLGLCLAGLGAACSGGSQAPQAAFPTMDAVGRQACSDLQAVMEAKSSGAVDTQSLVGEIAQVAGQAAQSSNQVLQARAMALLSDASAIANGGESHQLDADLAAMNAVCQHA